MTKWYFWALYSSWLFYCSTWLWKLMMLCRLVLHTRHSVSEDKLDFSCHIVAPARRQGINEGLANTVSTCSTSACYCCANVNLMWCAIRVEGSSEGVKNCGWLKVGVQPPRLAYAKTVMLLGYYRCGLTGCRAPSILQDCFAMEYVTSKASSEILFF